MSDKYRAEKDALYAFEVQNVDASRADIERAKQTRKTSVFQKPHTPSYEPGGWDKVYGSMGGFSSEFLAMAGLSYVDHPDFLLNKAPWELVISKGTIDDCKRMFSAFLDGVVSKYGMELRS